MNSQFKARKRTAEDTKCQPSARLTLMRARLSSVWPAFCLLLLLQFCPLLLPPPPPQLLPKQCNAVQVLQADGRIRRNLPLGLFSSRLVCQQAARGSKKSSSSLSRCLLTFSATREAATPGTTCCAWSRNSISWNLRPEWPPREGHLIAIGDRPSALLVAAEYHLLGPLLAKRKQWSSKKGPGELEAEKQCVFSLLSPVCLAHFREVSA